MIKLHWIKGLRLTQLRAVQYKVAHRLVAEVEPGGRRGATYLARDPARLIPSFRTSRKAGAAACNSMAVVLSYIVTHRPSAKYWQKQSTI